MDWCILRTSSRHTIPLSEALALDGFDVWTPIETRTIRVPRKNVKREIRLPIMPSYVFANVVHLIDLFELAKSPVGIGFSVMHAFGDQIPLVPDAHLANLRRIEVKRTPIKKADKTFIPGVTVKVGGGSFGGMTGRVERSDKGHTLVCFNDRYLVKIPTLLLNADGVCDEAEIGLLKAA